MLLSKRIISYRKFAFQSLSQPYSKLLERIADPKRSKDIALIDPSHHLTLTYQDLDHYSTILANSIESKVSSTTIGAFNKPSISFVVSLLATWKLQKTFVPLCVTHSVGELSYFIEDSDIQMILCGSKSDVDKDTLPLLKPAMFETNTLLKQPPQLHDATHSIAKHYETDDALIMYTSGTTGRPKGVVHTHDSLLHMIKGLVEAWQYTSDDKLLHFLPLYHLHGMLNKLLCMLWVGGTIEFLPSAHAPVIWDRLIHESETAPPPQANKKPLSLFMAVPTVYAKMIEHVSQLTTSQRTQGVATMKAMRLMVCGSAALPDIIMDQWYALTGQSLLERYGMTELGMVLSNPYQGERRKGYVGQPLPYVHCRIVNEAGEDITTANTPGELLVSGKNVFRAYLHREDATKESFVDGKWFKTGDIAEVSSDGYYKLLGRSSSDIIKSSGYKISALEIERELLSHPEIAEAAVLGKPDIQLGEIIVAVITLRTLPTSSTNSPHSLHHEHARTALLSTYLHDKLTKYKTPRVYHIVSNIPRNHLGKVNKKTLLRDLQIV